MKRETPEEKWKRLTALARQAGPVESDLAVERPGALATRVAARWCAEQSPRGFLNLLEPLAWIGAATAVATCALWMALASPAADRSESLAFDALLFAPLAEPPAAGGLLF